DAVRFNDGSGVVQSGPRGGKRTMKITVRGADKSGTNAAAANAGGTTEDFRAALELPRGTGPLLAQNGAKELPLLNTETGNTDASNLTLNTANIVSLIHHNVGRQFTTVRLLPLLSPPAAQGTYGINFHGAYRAANADVTGTLGPGPANQANWVNTSSGVVVNSGPGNWSWTANDSNGGNPITFHFVHGNAGGEDGGGGGATDFARLFSTGERSNDGVFTITSTTSIPFSLYDIYIYGGGGYTVNTSGVTTSFAAVDGFVSGANTWLYSGRSGPLTINGGSINGFSIVPIPPPTAYWKGTTGAGWNGTPSNFTSDIAGTIPITLQSSNPANVIFNANGATNFANTTLGADITIRTLTFSNNATPSVGIGGSNTLTIKPDTSSTGILVESLSGDPTISTKVALGANQTWTITDGTQTLAVSGLISGAFSLTKAGVGTLILSGASTYTGATIINSGMLSINSIQNAGSATPNALGNPAVGPNSAISLAAAGTLRFTGSSNGSSDRAINLSTATGGTFTLDASGITTFALSGGVTSSGTSNVSTLTLTGAGNGTESGQIVNGTAPNITSVVKNGGGTWILGNTNNTYSGTTTVNEGKLQISGFITSNTTVNAASLAVSGTLAGTVTANGISTITLSGTITGTTTVNNGSILVGDNGTLGNVVINSGGTFSPGSGAIGSLTVNGSLNLNTSSILSIQFDSTAPATDQIFGGVNLNITTGATLNISDIGSNPELAYNIPASIITYSGSWNGGTFVGLPDDTYFTSGGRNFLISYNGADPDVPEGVLTITMVQNVPEPGAAVSLLGGLGILLGVRRRRV
ncbi:MAG: autotransporter-associated beta strand repeat-containing protein, partial [Verrucomicrobiota bacterium]